MSGRFFLDTNVFVYSFDGTAPQKAKRARELIREAILTRRGIVSYQVVQEFFNVALRRFAVPLSALDAQQYLATTFRPLLALHSSSGLFGEALGLSEKAQLSWFDSLIVVSAIEAECEVLFSEDLQHGQKFGTLKVINPFL
jgi:predicted nucleic acid-binding protein